MNEPLLSNHAVNIALNEAQSRFSFLSKFRETRLANLRPLSDFFDRHRIRITTSFPEITKRWSYNLNYFGANYFLIFLALAIYVVITNWVLLFTIAFVFGGFYVISRLDGPLTIAGQTFSTSSLYTGYAITSLFLFLFSGATGAVFWIIGAAGLIILAHAAILEPGLDSEFSADGRV